jgi:hypothetical protein
MADSAVQAAEEKNISRTSSRHRKNKALSKQKRSNAYDIKTMSSEEKTKLSELRSMGPLLRPTVSCQLPSTFLSQAMADHIRFLLQYLTHRYREMGAHQQHWVLI